MGDRFASGNEGSLVAATMSRASGQGRSLGETAASAVRVSAVVAAVTPASVRPAPSTRRREIPSDRLVTVASFDAVPAAVKRFGPALPPHGTAHWRMGTATWRRYQ
jgi:hypothetical protein